VSESGVFFRDRTDNVVNNSSTATAQRSRIPRRPLPGKLVAPALPRRSIAPLPDVSLDPSAANQAAIIVADQVVAELSLMGARLTRQVLPGLLMEASAKAMDELVDKRLDRRSSVMSKAAAANILRFHQPLNLVQARPEWLAAGVANVAGASSLLSRRRIVWSDPTGITAGLLIDRIHHTHLPRMLLDAWMSGKVATDIRAGRAVAGEAFLGVRVISHRAPMAGIHVLSLGVRHPLGACDSCVGRVI